MLRSLTATLVLFLAQQLPDREYTPSVAHPAFAKGSGPVIVVDEGHQNAQTTADRLTGFVKLVEADGFKVRVNKEKLNPEVLADAGVLMISNARPASDVEKSAFTAEEIRVVREWVQDGGALLLIADHMPLAGAAAGLAKAFGVEFFDSFALPRFIAELPTDEAVEATYNNPLAFTRTSGTLRNHVVTDGINQVATFTGQAFRGQDLQPLLVFPAGIVSVFPSIAWQFHGSPVSDAENLLQGAVKTMGRGRAAFFGEAAMFTAQTWGPGRTPMGLNHPLAKENAQFVLNLLHWLAVSTQTLPRVVIETDAGMIEAEIDVVRAPKSGENFLKYADGGYYNGGRFFRTVRADNQPNDKVKIAVVQGEANRETVQAKGGFPPIPLERTRDTGLKHVDGTLSMARSGPDTARHSFSIVVGDQPGLDYGSERNPDLQGFAAFGRVVSGMDVVRKINAMPAGGPTGQTLTTPVTIIRIYRR